MDGVLAVWRKFKRWVIIIDPGRCIGLLCIVFIVIMFIGSGIYWTINYYSHPNPKAPAYSVVDVPLTNINGSSRFTGGGGGGGTATIILNTRNRNKRKYTNDYGGSSQTSLYFGSAAAQEQVVNATLGLGAFLQPPRTSNNFTLTFPAPAAALEDGSTAVIKMTAQLRFLDKWNYGQLQVTCKLSYSSQRQGFDVPVKCDVQYSKPIICWNNRRGYRFCQTQY